MSKNSVWYDNARAIGRYFDLNEAGFYTPSKIPHQETTYRGKARRDFIIHYMEHGGLATLLSNQPDESGVEHLVANNNGKR